MIKSPSVHSNNFSLHNVDNYLKVVNKDTRLLREYTYLIYEFLQLCSINITIKNIDYLKFVIIKGIESISHIFNTIFLYSKNIELTKYHCSKASHYYLEFIGQIGEDSHSFLQLSSKDAILFIYKKTIYDINNSFRKEFNTSPEDEYVLLTVKTETSLINNILFLLLEKDVFIDINTYTQSVSNKLKNIINKMGNINKFKTDIYVSMCNNIILFVETNKHSKCNLEQIIPFLELFVKKNIKITNSDKNLKSILKQNDIQELYQYMTPSKFINLLTN